MMPLFADDFGNPSSSHASGRAAAEVVEEARGKVADSVGMRRSDVIFTSGATEANNLALCGLRRGIGRRIGVAAGATEHKSVLQVCAALAEDGSEFSTLPVRSDGTINLDMMEPILGDDTDIVSVMAANSETGVIHPVEEVAKMAHDHGALLHCDATQAVGKIPFDGGRTGADMVTLSSHKIYGPKGCGALVATREARRAHLSHHIWRRPGEGDAQRHAQRSGDSWFRRGLQDCHNGRAGRRPEAAPPPGRIRAPPLGGHSGCFSERRRGGEAPQHAPT